MTVVAEDLNLGLWRALCTRVRCWRCKHHFAHPFFDPQPGQSFAPEPDGEWLFHLSDTHGLPSEIVVGLVADRLFLRPDLGDAYRSRWSG